MSDMMKAIEPKSDQINADDLIGGPITVTIDEVTVRPGQDQPVQMRLKETPKFFRPSKSMSRVLVTAWGDDHKAYAGRKIKLYRDPEVKWGGIAVGGIRISHLSGLSRDMQIVLTASKGVRKPYTVQPLDDDTDVEGQAMPHARKGKEAFTAWWNSDEGKDLRAKGLKVTDAIKKAIAAADAKTSSLAERMKDTPEPEPSQEGSEGQADATETPPSEASADQEEEGRKAFVAGMKPEMCPFDEGTDQWDAWLSGYNEEKRARDVE